MRDDLQDDKCLQLHKIFNSMNRHRFPFKKRDIPKNGIYILFEDGEKAHSMDRIVRVGTHTGTNQLPSRLEQHFIKENKDRSIFRKNIGRAILNKRKDKFLEDWEIDRTPHESRKNVNIDIEKLKSIEKEVSAYIQKNFGFVVFRIDDKDKRLEMESKIISTISSCNECTPSDAWLGNYSPKEKICKSGLWLVNELYKKSLDDKDMRYLKEILVN